MSYVTAMLRRRARTFAEEASWWRREAKSAADITSRRIALVHDFAVAPLEGDPSLVDVTFKKLRVEDVQPLAFQLRGINAHDAAHLAEMLDAIFANCTKRRAVPYRARAREIYERNGGAVMIEILSLSVPTQGGRR